ncbi:MAG TPA: PAS domain-containing sensor histidine kinase [Lacipirellula sp.]
MNAKNAASMNPDELLQMLEQQATEYALMILDPEGRIIHWLAGAETIFGYAASEVIGQQHSMLFASEDIEQGAPQKELAIADSGSPAEDDRWMRRKDGLRFWANGVLQAMRSPEGAIIGYGKMLRNRTDLKGHIESLENEIRTLKHADERKNGFISTLAHELRNPLSSLTNAAELLKAELRDTQDAAFAMAIILRQMDAMRRLVDDLLDITRISTGKVKLELRDMALEDVLKAAVETCRPLIDDRTHELHLILGKEPVIVRADPARLQQVFVNLIQNAAKYTEYGGIIWVKLLVEGREAVVKIEDTGIGISPELLPRIFDMFTQAEFAERESGGLGIGLSVVRDITRLHGGAVTVRSDGIGKGSEFTVRLPLAGTSAKRPDSPARDA